MTRSTLVLVAALACSCRSRLETAVRADDARQMRSMAAEQEAMLAQQKACRAKRSQVFTEAEVQGLGERSGAVWLGKRATGSDARLTRVANVLRTKVPVRSWQFWSSTRRRSIPFRFRPRPCS